MADIASEIKRRRTFAIISHPDAGKTTLTEKFLLYGGAINLAGSVKGKATARHAVSDWMEIEKERGISVTSSVLQFNYDGFCTSKRSLALRPARSTGRSVPERISKVSMSVEARRSPSLPIQRRVPKRVRQERSRWILRRSMRS